MVLIMTAWKLQNLKIYSGDIWCTFMYMSGPSLLIETFFYAKTYNLNDKMEMYIYYISVKIFQQPSVYHTISRVCLSKAWRRAVLFHTTAMHCHYGMDIDDATFIVLEKVLQVCPEFKVWVSQKILRNARASSVVTKKGSPNSNSWLAKYDRII